MLLLFACQTPSPIGLGGTDSAAPNDSAIVVNELGFDCGPEGGEVSVSEGEQASLQFACTGTGVADHWVLESGPPGATLNDSGLLTWQTDLASAGEWRVQAKAVGRSEETGTGTIWVVDAWSAPGNIPVDPLTYTEENGLPVLHIHVPADINLYTKVPSVATYRGETYDVQVEYRGAASSYYPKLSYELDFPADHEFSDSTQNFDKSRSIAVITTFDDNAYFRQKMVYDLWNAMNPERQQIHSMFAVVYLDGEYEGLYTITDHIDGEWWEDAGFREDGNLYKSVDHSANFYTTYGGPKSTIHSGFEKKEGLPEDDFSDLDAFIDFVETASNDTFDAEIADKLALEDIYDWWSLVIFVEGDDSGGKNAYLYNDPLAPMWHHAPWDFNHSLGQTWQTERELPTYDYDFLSANGLFYRLRMSAAYGDEMSAHFRTHRETVLAPAVLEALIDDYVARIDASARRDWDKWEYDYEHYGGWSWRSDFTSYDEEVAYVRVWLQRRAAFIADWNP